MKKKQLYILTKILDISTLDAFGEHINFWYGSDPLNMFKV